jgi:hypothetical protein
MCELDTVLPQAEFFKQDPGMALPLGEWTHQSELEQHFLLPCQGEIFVQLTIVLSGKYSTYIAVKESMAAIGITRKDPEAYGDKESKRITR